ncbi:MAG TPA: hypothetical protein VN461_00295 [Vicinamibacteria bacterium]|nr:hypothetical protein [Vicinamibacteria bacterium]
MGDTDRIRSPLGRPDHAVARSTNAATLAMPGNTDQHWTIDTTLICEDLAYREPVAKDEAIRRTIAWEGVHAPKVDEAMFDYAAEDAALRSIESAQRSR